MMISLFGHDHKLKFGKRESDMCRKMVVYIQTSVTKKRKRIKVNKKRNQKLSQNR